MGQAKNRGTYEERKAKAIQEAKKVKEAMNRLPDNYLHVKMEYNGDVNGYQEFAAPICEVLNEKHSNVLNSIKQMTDDTIQNLPSLSRDNAKILASATYLVQSIANGIVEKAGIKVVFPFCVDVLYRSFKHIYGKDVRFVEISMSTHKSPMSIMGLENCDTFIPALHQNDGVILKDKNEKVLCKIMASDIWKNNDVEKATDNALQTLMKRAWDKEEA